MSRKSKNGSSALESSAQSAAKQELKATPKTQPVLSNSHRICDSILDCIGETPLVRLNRVAKDVPCQVLVKCEFLNAGGSVKDRIGKQMVLDAEKQNKITPHVTTLIEPTSGNTGIGLAITAAVRDYKCIITMPEKMSKEKVRVLKALGAEIIRTPTEAAYDAPDSHISVAKRLESELPGAHILDQYTNPSNPNAHYENTAGEILRQLGDTKLDMLVCGAGTGGTISGLSKRLKENFPDLIVVGVDPHGSILAQPETLNSDIKPYQVEGIGYDFIPGVLDRSMVDKWIKSNDKDSLVMMRRLIRHEGLLCGGSSGAAVSAALSAAKSLRPDQTCVVILPDSVRNYMTKALCDEWMLDHNFTDVDLQITPPTYQTWWASRRIADLLSHMDNPAPLTISSDITCKDAISLLKKEGFDMVPVLDDSQELLGVVTEGNMTQRVLRSSGAMGKQTVEEAGVIYKTFRQFSMKDKLGDLAQALDHEPYALIVTEQRCFRGRKKRKTEGGTDHDDDENSSIDSHSKPQVWTRSVVSGIVSRIDLLEYISGSAGQQE